MRYLRIEKGWKFIKVRKFLVSVNEMLKFQFFSNFRKALQTASSTNFKNILKNLTGSESISTDALIEYYEPLTQWLKVYFEENGIEV